MYSFVLTVMDLVYMGNLHWYMIFFLFIIIRWLFIFPASFRYRKYDCEPEDFFTSVIIPVVDEDPDLFRMVLQSILCQNPNQLLVVINGPKNQGLMDLCREFQSQLEEDHADTRFDLIYTPVAGKRNAIRLGMDRVASSSQIVLIVDSDTIWDKDVLYNMKKPFTADPLVGGVTTRQRIYKPERSTVTMIENILEEIRAEGTMKAMSSSGKVGCLPGRTIAFRTDILRRAMPAFMTETFMGIHKEVSDDRSLTNLTLRYGYKTVLQDDAVVYTDAPVTWGTFIRQQLRWAEGSQYNNIRMFPWMLKHAPRMCFIYFSDMLLPFLLCSVYVNIFFCLAVRLFGYYVPAISYGFPLLANLCMILIGAGLGFGTRNVKILNHLPLYYIFLFPFLPLVLSILLAPVRIIGLMRCADLRGWGTRNLTEETNETNTSS